MRKDRRLPIEELAPYLLEVPVATDPNSPASFLDWTGVFGNPHPVEIEVGFGKGLFLLNEAPRRPHVNFLGVEIERKYQLFTATRVAKRRLGNIRLACDDARLFLRGHVPSASIQTVHVYFPDPWWKKRHYKRRVFTAEFVRECARVITLGGQLSVATDVEDYFQIIIDLVRTSGLFQELPAPDETAPTHEMDYMTNFERKARKDGKPIFRAVWKRAERKPD